MAGSDRVLEEPDRAVAEEEVRAAGVAAPEAPLAVLQVFRVVEPRLVVRRIRPGRAMRQGIRTEVRVVAGHHRRVDPRDLVGEPLRPRREIAGDGRGEVADGAPVVERPVGVVLEPGRLAEEDRSRSGIRRRKTRPDTPRSRRTPRCPGPGSSSSGRRSSPGCSRCPPRRNTTSARTHWGRSRRAGAEAHRSGRDRWRSSPLRRRAVRRSRVDRAEEAVRPEAEVDRVVRRGLLQHRQDHREHAEITRRAGAVEAIPAALGDGVGRVVLDRPEREDAEGALVVGDRQADLLEVIHALGPPRGLPRRLDRGQQQQRSGWR